MVWFNKNYKGAKKDEKQSKLEKVIFVNEQ